PEALEGDEAQGLAVPPVHDERRRLVRRPLEIHVAQIDVPDTRPVREREGVVPEVEAAGRAGPPVRAEHNRVRHGPMIGAHTGGRIRGTSAGELRKSRTLIAARALPPVDAAAVDPLTGPPAVASRNDDPGRPGWPSSASP